MKILFFTTDLYLNLAGGGQELMRKIIESLPEYNFYYFVDKEPFDYKRPVNCFTIRLKRLVDVKIKNNYKFNTTQISALKTANHFARSAKNLEFDIVEIPDYNYFGAFIRTTFKNNNVKFKKLVINLLGNISNTIELNWNNSGCLKVEEIIDLEKKQFLSSDFSYSLSSRYIKDWQPYTKKKIFNLTPLNLIKLNKTLKEVNPSSKIKPNLLFLGRFEKRKGPDLFLEICSKINKDLYQDILLYGDDDFSNNGNSAISHLFELSKHYGINIQIHKTVASDELSEVYAANNILILPVRYDTFNLIALDALFSGSILFVSNRAGFCDFANTNFPNLNYYNFDIEKIDDQIEKIEDALVNFTTYKNNLIDSLSKLKKVNTLAIEMSQFYTESLNSDVDNYENEINILYNEIKFSLKYMLVNLLSKYGSPMLYRKILFIRKQILNLKK